MEFGATKKQPSARPDLTYIAVKQQIEAMGCEHYEIGILDRGNNKQKGSMKLATYSKDSILKAVPYFKSENSSNNRDIFIRPSRAHKHANSLILVDDINKSMIDDTMKKKGYEPCCAVQTSPYNYQAWVKLNSGINPELQGVISRQLQQTLSADAGSASKEHFGRLAGFTNRKPCHVDDAGMHPFAKLKESTGVVATSADKLIQEGKDELRRQNEILSSTVQSKPLVVTNVHISANGIDAWWESTMATLDQRTRGQQDMSQSRIDFSIATMLADKGCSLVEVAEALTRNSPGLTERKPGHESEYAMLTSAKAQVWSHAKSQGLQYKDISATLSHSARALIAENARANIVAEKPALTQEQASAKSPDFEL
ncbi:hypothetical protein HAP94_09990 [Acidithiobacillus ferrivorans]|nr:hypothetical protein [Acidithiobacillus ferrivorans]